MALLFCFSITATLFLALWLFQEKTKNASYVDVGWSASIGIQSIIYYLFSEQQRIHQLLLIVVIFWSLRLSTHLFKRLKGQPEDRRYANLRRSWKKEASKKFLGVHIMNLVVSFAMASSLIPLYSTTSTPPFFYFGCAFALISLLLETLADWQLKSFVSKKENRGKTLDTGLWKYSRHPNYFFEWLFWLSIGVMSLGASYWPVAFIAPAVIYYFLTRVTGVPMNDAKTSKRVGYEDYVQKTSEFFPWFPKP